MTPPEPKPSSPAAAARSPLMPLDTALAQLLAEVSPLSGEDWVSTLAADGRVLAEDVVSPLQVPAFDQSAMDGYALRCADVHTPGQELPVSQRIAAGQSGQALQPGTVARIMTGAPLPAGADAVLMQEDASPLPGDTPRIHLHIVPQPGQWIRRAGEDVQRGAKVLTRGHRLDPAALGLAASLGRDRLRVLPRPRVALFSTGDELVMPGQVPPERLPHGAIYNSNRFFLHALLNRLGCTVSDMGIVPDRRDATVQALAEAARAHDVILSSGGVSVGEEDHLKPAVQQLGRLHLWQIAIKPGKPFAYGQIGASHFLGLPGNPVSSFITFVWLVRPVLLRLQGLAPAPPQGQALRADFDWPRPDRRREFLRVRRNAEGGLSLFPNQSSGVLTSLVWGDGVIDNPPGQAIARGDTVRFMAWDGLLS